MAEDNNIPQFSATDIEKYHRGELTPGQMHAMEKAALDDPFLADAMEGYAVAGVNIAEDIDELKQRLERKKNDGKVIPLGGRNGFPWLRVAIMIVVVATAGFFSYQWLNPGKSPAISESVPKKPAVMSNTDDSGSVASPDTAPLSGLAGIKPGEEKNTGISADGGVKANTDKDRTTDRFDDTRSVESDKKIINGLFSKQPTAAAPNDPVHDSLETQMASVAREKARSADAGYREKEAMNNATASRKAQVSNYSNANRFRGVVTDVNNNPLPFANITNVKDNVGTYSDAKGNFVLLSTDTVLDVQVRSLGYENSKVRLRGNLPGNQVTLQEDRSISARVLDTAKRNSSTHALDGNLTFEEPEPADGWSSYDTYLANNLNEIPEAYEVKKNTGSDVVELSFEVNKNGEPVNIKVVKSLCERCDQEAIRLIKEGPKWRQKAKKGKRTTVKVPFSKLD